jgi:hypothetical protein
MFFHPPHPGQPISRRGAVLLVVITMLVLFAAVGLAFVYYANSEANASRNNREAQTAFRADVEPELALAYFLSKLVYGDKDDVSGVYSAMRGHDLARLVFEGDPTSPITAFNGLGRQHNTTYTFPNLPAGLDDFNMINYQYFQTLDKFLRDPGRPGALGFRPDLTVAANPISGGLNVPYTYSDANNMFLAVVNANGEVLQRSFHRDWLFNWPVGPGTYYALDDLVNNPNWTNPQGKYYILCPRPLENPGFPPPVDGGGHVKNLDGWGFLGVPVVDPITGLKTGKYYNMDSIWMDLGAPVLIAPDGTKYKMLFAPLVMELDGKLNMNVVGNIRGTGPPVIHVSNQGWGPWEINLSRLLNKNPGEWTQLYTGFGTLKGRYAATNLPGGTGGTSAPTSPEWPPRFFAYVDFDAAKSPNPNYTLSDPYVLPGEGASKATNAYVPFATFPAGPIASPSSYGNNNANEALNHPLLFNVFSPGAQGNLIYPARNMEALLRYGGTGSPTFNSELFNLLPNELLNSRARLLLTTHSFDYVRPGARAWLYDNVTAPYTQGLLPSVALYPTGLPLGSKSPLPITGEFGPDSRAVTAALGRLNINRPLRNYPPPDATTGYLDLTAGTNQKDFLNAQQDRQNLAQDIFNCLCWVTMGMSSTNAIVPANADQNAVRWLAQLAVNIVDFRDSDDFITPFNWNGVVADPTGWVYGTEPSRAVLNEVYGEVDNDPTDPFTGGLATKPYQYNFWAELHNPLLTDGNTGHPSADLQQNYARLHVFPPAATLVADYAAYQVLITKDSISTTAMRVPANTTGDPDYNLVAPNLNSLSKVTTYTDANGAASNLVQPANGGFMGPNGGNTGFYLLGPAAAFPSVAGATPAPPIATMQVPNMMYQPAALADPPVATFGMVLRRLIYPCLPPQTDPTLPNYNPYVTVDYVEKVPANDGRTFNTTAANVPAVITTRTSVGRNQPYAADQSNIKVQAPNPANTGQPQHTFFFANATSFGTQAAPVVGDATLNLPFSWLVHLDRQTISPMELLHVSGFAPHLLTQQFWAGSAIYPVPAFGVAPSAIAPGASHRAPWFDPTARIYRLFEYLENASRASGVGARVAGKLNINMIWDPEPWNALCDAQPLGNTAPNVPNPQVCGFTDADVTSIYTAMLARRSTGPGGMPGPNDVPFQGMAMGNVAAGDTQFPNGSGINNTFLIDSDPTGKGTALTPRLFQVTNAGATNPFRQFELMTKIYNNVTTRSNVFAVWVTVGFFKVTDDTTRPVKLGAEIGAAEGRNVRHRMFAIIDRSQLIMPAVAGLGLAGPVAAPGITTVPVSALQGVGNTITGTATFTRNGATNTYAWTIQPGTNLVVDTGANQEVVFVSAVDNTVNPPTITAVFYKIHAVGAALAFPGNQGPIQRYDPRTDEAVVPYFSIIE